MTTRRERLEAKADKRREWAQSRTTKAAVAFERSDLREEKSGIPFGQPVLVGHHSEGRHRRALERADHAMSKACEHSDMAKHHASAADGIEHQLETSIFSDDPDAIEALEAKAAKLEAKAKQANAFNAAWRKAMKGSAGDIDKAAAAVCAAFGLSDKTRDALAADAKRFSCSASRGPMSASHERAEARRCKKRIEEVKARQARAEKAEAAGGVLVTRHLINGGADEWVQVTFSDKPDRKIIDALKAADFRWSGGHWGGYGSKLPASVVELVAEASAS